jgi:hypothetical protein
MAVHHLGVVVALVALGSCSLFTEACGCSPPNHLARAIGTVTFASGEPAAGATVGAAVWRPPCESVPSNPFPHGETTTDAQGVYRLEFSTVSEGLQCARIAARLGAAEVGRVVTVEGRVQGTRPLDSVRVNLTLP